jgi:hypothetical protein
VQSEPESPALEPPSFEDIAVLVAEMSSTPVARIGADTELETDLGMVGDDFDEIIEAVASRYGTDFSRYLWYFHTDPEGCLLDGLIDLPSRHVPRIPITVQMLWDSTCAGRWCVEYPPHDIPDFRLRLRPGVAKGVVCILSGATLFLLVSILLRLLA